MQKALRASLPVLFSVLAFGATAPLAFAANEHIVSLQIHTVPDSGAGTSVTADTSIALAVQAFDNTATATTTEGTLVVALSDGGSGGVFTTGIVSTGACNSTVWDDASDGIGTGTQKGFCYKNSTPGAYTLTAAAGALSTTFDITVTPAPSATIVGGATYGTIQEAITNAVPNDVINVGPGTYNENLNISTPITLQSVAGAGSTIISGTGNVITINADDVTINGFTVTNGNTHGMGVYSVDHGNLTITNNIVTGIGNSGNDVMGRGVVIVSSANPIDGITISNNQINNITSGMRTGGTSVSASGVSIGWSTGTGDITGLVLDGNTISNISADTNPWTSTTKGQGAYGILINHASGKNGHTGRTVAPQITNNTISDLEGLWVHAIGLEGNTPDAFLSNNTISDLIDHKTPSDAFAIFFEDNAGKTTVSIDGVTYGATTTVAVNAGWNGLGGNPLVSLNGESYIFGVNAFSTIQGGINAVADDGMVNVGAGTYNEHDITINKSLTLTGDVGDAQPGPGANAPIIDGQSLYSDGFLLSGGVSNVTIQGFEIRNYIGTGNGVGNAIQAWVASTSNITVNDNYMHNLSWNGVLVGNDGAIGDHSYWTIARNKLTDFGPSAFANSGYGLELTNTSHGVIEDNIVDGGSHFPGAGILVTMRRPLGQDILIQRNSVRGQFDNSGIYIGGFGYEVPNNNLDDVRILNNDVDISGTAPRALRVLDFSTGTATNVVVHGNKLIKAGGYGIANQTAVTLLDATNNWWGTASSTEVITKVSGSVNYTPWYINSGRTVLSDAFVGDTITASTGNFDLPETATGEASLPTGATDVILSDTSALDLSSATTSDSGSETVGDQTVDVAKSVVLQSGVDTEPVVLTNSGLSGVTASIPDGTKIQGPAEWDGTIAPPKAVTGSGNAPSGFSVGGTVIEVGAANAVLLFSSPVTLILSGVTGAVGYKPANSDTWVKITGDCGSYDNPTSPTFPGECAVSNGTDTKILTYHFTTFGGLAVGRGGGGRTTPSPSSATSAAPAVAATTPAPGQVLGVAVFQFTNDIHMGSSGADVTELQKSLIAGRFDIPAITKGGADYGYFGGQTLAAVIAYQRAQGIWPPAGYVGPLTRAQLNKGTTTASTATTAASATAAGAQPMFTKALTVGVRSADVTALQQYLTDNGFYSGPVTGYFGELTKAAVQIYQKEKGIAQTGYVGPLTLGELNKGKGTATPAATATTPAATMTTPAATVTTPAATTATTAPAASMSAY